MFAAFAFSAAYSFRRKKAVAEKSQLVVFHYAKQKQKSYQFCY